MYPAQGRWPGFDLVGFDLDRAESAYRPGDIVYLQLWWRATGDPGKDWTVFTHLLGPAKPDGNRVWAGSDAQPGQGSVPTTTWAPGDLILDEYQLQLPPDAPPGDYEIEVGLYNPAANGARAVATSAGRPGSFDSGHDQGGASAMIRPRDGAVQADTGLGLKPHAGMIGVIVLLAGLAAIPLRLPGIANSDDILPTIYRVFSLHASWQAGVFYPRLSSDLAYAYGVPLFQFYPPLASYVAELFHVLGFGFINAIKATYFLGLVCAGLGMYVYVVRLYGARAGALLAAVAYMYAPYYFVDIYKRGAMAEALALALLPWLLWAFYNLHQTEGRGWFVLSALGLAALVLTHNSLSLFFLPLLIVYCAVLGSGRRWWLCLAAVTLGLGLSAFFWLPAIAERGYVNLTLMTQGMYDVMRYLLPLRDLLQNGIFFDYAAPQAFRWGLLPAILALVGFVVGLWQLKSQRRLILFFASIVVIALLLQSSLAGPFWARVPLARFIQFPWRLQTFVALGGAILIGALPAPFVQRSQTSAGRPGIQETRASWLVAGALAALLIFTATTRLWPAYQAAWQAAKFGESDISRQEMYARGRADFELFGDYRPIWVAAAMTEMMNGRPTPVGSAPQPWPTPTVQVLRWRPAQFAAQVSAQASFPLAFFTGSTSRAGRPRLTARPRPFIRQVSWV